MGLSDIMAASKSLAFPPKWSKEHATGYVWFLVPLEIGGIVEQELVLQGGAHESHPDRHVTFELRHGRPRRQVQLQRVDWRSLTGGHTNKRREGSPLSGKRVSDSHFHEFALNFNAAEGRMIGSGLPFARDLPSHIQSFESLRDFCGPAFRIANLDLVGRPPWAYNLGLG